MPIAWLPRVTLVNERVSESVSERPADWEKEGDLLKCFTSKKLAPITASFQWRTSRDEAWPDPVERKQHHDACAGWRGTGGPRLSHPCCPTTTTPPTSSFLYLGSYFSSRCVASYSQWVTLLVDSMETMAKYCFAFLSSCNGFPF